MTHSSDRGQRIEKRATRAVFDTSQDGSDDVFYKDVPYIALTREEAQALRAKQPMISPWRVVAAQAGVGFICVLVAFVFVRQGGAYQSAAWSALYGAAAVVIPSALLARGMTKRADSPTAAAMGLMVWEMMKIAVAIAMLVIAARVVPQLNWPVLLVTMVVCSQMNWFALLWRGR
jgi:ATP synthase protein I